MSLITKELSVTTTGSAGSALGSSSVAVPLSELVAVHIDYHASAPAGTTDLTISTPAPSPGTAVALTILTLTNTVTDGWFYPRVQDHDNVGAAITGSYSEPPVHGGSLLVSIAQSDALTNAAVVTFLLRV